jgi:peptide/nickel transport system permease protein|tara:strand:+ start:103 stop:1101 length:999 start_codon:yes stop_codon:yes gene_type:complete
MVPYIIRRLLHMIPTLILISMVSFVVIQAPPGDMLTSRMAELAEQGEMGSESAMAQIEALRERYGLNDPIYIQYFRWIGKIVLEGDFGESFTYEMDVIELLGERLGLTLTLTLSTLVFTWLVAIPIGVYSATRAYSLGDYGFTLIGFVGLATPNFMLALIIMFIQVTVFQTESVGGLLSPEFIGTPWSLAKVGDLLAHIWVPIVVIGTGGTATVIRIMRGNLLDVLGQQHIQTGRAKGLKERKVIAKYGVRLAINPLVSRVGTELPNLLSGAVVTGIVLGLPTAGPVFLTALTSQDMFLAGAFLLLSATFLLLGNLLADIILAWLDPRIRYE